MDNINKESYDKIISKWHSYRKHTNVNKLIINFEKLLKPKSLILDAGCGTGFPIDHFLVKKEHRVVGVDISKEMISVANTYELANCNYINSDIISFDSKEKFDGIIAYDSLFHLNIEDQKIIFKKLSSLLNINGVLMFTHRKEDGEIISKMYDETFYYSAVSLNSLKKRLIEADFIITEIIEDFKDDNDTRDLVVYAKRV